MSVHCSDKGGSTRLAGRGEGVYKGASYAAVFELHKTRNLAPLFAAFRVVKKETPLSFRREGGREREEEREAKGLVSAESLTRWSIHRGMRR